MTGDAELVRQVTRVENDTMSLDELVTEIRDTQDEHTGRLAGLDRRLDGMDKRLDGIETTLVEVVRRLPEPPPSPA